MSSSLRMFSGVLYAFTLGAQPAPKLPAKHPIAIWRASLAPGAPGVPFDNGYGLKDIGDNRDEAARALIALLKDNQSEVRGYAATALGQFRLAPELSVPPLIQAFQDEDDFVREHAAMALAAFGKAALPDLVRALDWEPDYDKRPLMTRTRATYGAVSLALIGTDAVDSVLAKPDAADGNPYALAVLNQHARYAAGRLSELLRSPDEKIRLAALSILADMKTNGMTAAPQVLDRIASPSLAERRAAETTLLQWPPLEGDPKERAVRLFLNALDDPDVRFQSAAIEVLGQFQGLSDQAIVRIARLYASKESGVRDAVVSALGSIGKGSPRAKAVVTQALNDQDPFTRQSALKALAAVEPSNPGPSIRALQDKDPAVRRTAAQVTRSFHGQEALLVPALAAAARNDQNRDVRIVAAESLVALAPKSATGVSALIRLLDSPDAKTVSVIEALRKMGVAAAPAVEALTAIGLKDARNTAAVVMALGNMGPSGIAAVQQIWDGESASQRGILLSRISGSDAAPLVPWLTNLYRSGGGQETNVLRALAQMRLPALEPLTIALKDPRPGIRALAAQGVALIVNNDKGAGLQALLAVADDPSPEVRAAAAEIGPSVGPAALAVLRKALSDPDKNVRYTAADGLRYGMSNGARLDDATLKAISETLGDKDKYTRIALLEALRDSGNRAAFAAPRIAVLVRDADEDVQDAAAAALAGIGSIPPDVAATVNRMLLDSYIADHVAGLVGDVEDDAGPMNERRGRKGPVPISASPDTTPAAAPAAQPQIPPLPWPMPQPSAWASLNKALLGSDSTRLKEVQAKLAKALAETGFSEPAVFSAPSGFALLAQVERIHEDGTPYAPPDRWSSGKLPLRSFSLKDYLSDLFFDTPGEFRLFVFVITTELDPVKSGATLSEDAAKELVGKGGRILPDSIGNLTLKGRNSFVLVYQFQRDQGQFATLAQSSISAQEHLQKAGIARAIQ